MISFSLKWRPYEVTSFYICVYLHLPVFLPKNLGNKEGHLLSCSGPIHPCLHWGSRLYLTPHPRPPPAQGFLTGRSERWVRKGPWGVRVFIRFSKTSMGKTTTTQGRTADRAAPPPLPHSPRSPSPSPLRSQHSPTASQLWVGGEKQSGSLPQKWLYHLLCLR